MLEIGPGSVVRLRNIRCYQPDPRNYVEFAPDRHKARDLKRVFVCVILGTEGYQLKKDDEVKMAGLDITQAMNNLGWYSADQLKEAKVSKRALKKLGEDV